MSNPSIQQLNWNTYNNAPTASGLVLTNLVPVTFGIANGNSNAFTVVPTGQYGSLGIVPADGIVIDNLLTANIIQVSVGGNVIETVPAYCKTTLTLGAGISIIQISAVIPASDNTSVTNFTFFKGAFPGSDKASDVFISNIKSNANVPVNSNVFLSLSLVGITQQTLLPVPTAPFRYYISSLTLAVTSNGDVVRAVNPGIVILATVFTSTTTIFTHSFLAYAKSPYENVLFPAPIINVAPNTFLPANSGLLAQNVFSNGTDVNVAVEINLTYALLVPGGY